MTKARRILLVTGDWMAAPRAKAIASAVEAISDGFAFDAMNSWDAVDALDADFLLRYDALLFGDIVENHYTPEQLLALREFVERGGGFVLCANHKFDKGADNFDALLPVRPLSPDSTPFHPEARHPALETLDWRSAPELKGRWEVETKPGAEALLVTPEGEPVLAAWELGRGRAAASMAIFANDELSEGYADWPDFGRFYAALFGWLCENSPAHALPAMRAVKMLYRVVVEPERSLGEISAGAFGIFGLAGWDGEHPDPADPATASLRALNLAGSHQRIETMIHLAQPDPGVFHPEKMHRSADNTGDRFLSRVRSEFGMEPVLLLDYNVGWLSERPSDRDATGWNAGGTSKPVTDPQAWAEFCVRTIRHYNGGGQPVIRFVEIWNEPNLAMFYSGTPEQYCELFNVAADRIHAEFPDVMVGGPCTAGTSRFEGAEALLRLFIERCGSRCDYYTWHHYGYTPRALVEQMDFWLDYAEQRTGKRGLMLLETENDFWLYGVPKLDWMMKRQFALLDRPDRLLGWLHFCLRAYNENGYVFGVIEPDGAPLFGTYWPYWIFRDLRGERIGCRIEGREAEHLFAIASRTADGTLATVIYHDRGHASNAAGEKADRAAVNVEIPLPESSTGWVASVSLVGEPFDGGRAFPGEHLPPHARAYHTNLILPPRTAGAITLRKGG